MARHLSGISPEKLADPESPSKVAEEEGKTEGDNVVYEHHRNTITVQSTKVIGEFNYSFVSVSPT